MESIFGQFSGTNPVYTSSGGSVGIGTGAGSLSNLLQISTSNAGDGARIVQSGSGATGLHFAPSTGHLWSLYSLGSSDGWCGYGGLAIQDQTGDPSYPRFIIDRSGLIGIGGIASPSAQFHIQTPNADRIALRIEHNYTGDYGYAALIDANSDYTKALVVQRMSGGTGTTVFQVYGNGTVNMKTAYAEVINVTPTSINSPWPDYVFNRKYKLRSLSDLEKYITKYQHLPNMPTQSQIAKQGMNVYEVNKVLVEKVEELTLYIIQMKKEIEAIKSKVK
jgi:hypothetical protein